MSEGELRLYKDLVNSEYVSHIDFKLIAKKLFDELQQKENIIKEVREEVGILESNCDISNYHAQKLYQTLDKKEVN